MLFDRRSEAPFIRHGFEQTFQERKQTFSHRITVFRMQAVFKLLILHSKSRLTSAEEKINLQIFSQKLLGKELVVTAFMTVRCGEGYILVSLLPVHLVAVHLHLVDKIFFAGGAAGNEICLTP
ncbi:unknown [Anaerotruncus sp. CAG:390]|nr:unknown [Anaerotruncus sp. CAG:390]